ncbi:hypothetical protein TNIN_150631 [Trichonephila inaurata madagascariensis]|uniref:Uncharacterized protein n=1 Tax=Trichonephila inaurata madagascariensis TaxID=2747483 RepID=A0A8X6YXE3_9ARAC|nr:hypothetical protein TNIN_150631 [Trichonephila inaurata madagascariensis]
MTISASTSIGYQCSIRLSLLSLLSKRGYGPLAFPEVPCSSLHFDLGFVLVGFSHIGWRGLPRVSKSFAKLSVLFLFRKPLAFEAMFHVENPPPPNEDFDYLSLPEKPEYFLWTTPNIPRGDQMKINYNLISKSFYFEKLKSSDEKDQEIKNSDESKDTEENIFSFKERKIADQDQASGTSLEKRSEEESSDAKDQEIKDSDGSEDTEENIFSNFPFTFKERKIADQDQASGTSLEKRSEEESSDAKDQEIKDSDGSEDTEENIFSNFPFTFKKRKIADQDQASGTSLEKTTKKKYEKTAQKIRSDVMNTKAVTDVISQLINYIEKSEEAEKKDLCPDEEGHHSRRSEKEMDYLSDEGRRRSLSI